VVVQGDAFDRSRIGPVVYVPLTSSVSWADGLRSGRQPESHLFQCNHKYCLNSCGSEPYEEVAAAKFYLFDTGVANMLKGVRALPSLCGQFPVLLPGLHDDRHIGVGVLPDLEQQILVDLARARKITIRHAGTGETETRELQDRSEW